MLTYGNSKTFTWEHGRELSGMTDASGNWSFAYNVDGLRVYRSNGTVTYKYCYSGDKLSRMVVNGEDITFGYDANGAPQYVIYGGHRYFYLTNLQGDITAIVSVNGNTVVRYTYDAWGNVLSIEGTRKDNLGKLNPLRYRGYIYDEETRLYYLQSRYYDPALGRFINSDVYASTGQGLLGNNMFAYCGNNPVYRSDSSGFFWETAFDVVSLGASIAEVAMNPSDIMAWVSLAGDTIDLLPFITGVGEVTRVVSVTVKATENTGDLVKAARKLYNQSDAASGIRKLTGSYEIAYESGMTYVGKGGFYRATTSAKRYADKGDTVLSITWTSARDNKTAFMDEFTKMLKHGGPNNREIGNVRSYNKIWSPGRNYLK